MYVEAVMSSPVVTCPPLAAAAEAARLMLERRFRHLPVVEAGELVGIVSDRDVAAADQRPLAQVMRRDVVSAPHDLPIEGAAALMLAHKIGCLPVLDDAGEVVGIVTESDLFRVLVQVLGVQEPSTRLRLRLGDLPKQLAIVAWIAHEHGVSITSLVTEPLPAHQPPTAGRTVVLRVGTIQAAPFVAALRGAGIDVDAPQRVLSGRKMPA